MPNDAEAIATMALLHKAIIGKAFLHFNTTSPSQQFLRNYNSCNVTIYLYTNTNIYVIWRLEWKHFLAEFFQSKYYAKDLRWNNVSYLIFT